MAGFLGFCLPIYLPKREWFGLVCDSTPRRLILTTRPHYRYSNAETIQVQSQIRTDFMCIKQQSRPGAQIIGGMTPQHPLICTPVLYLYLSQDLYTTTCKLSFIISRWSNGNFFINLSAPQFSDF